MYGKPAITYFKYPVVLYGLKAITYLKAILWVVTEPAVLVTTLPPPPTTGSPPPTLYGSITFSHLKENSCMVKLPYLFKKTEGNLYGSGTITCKTTIPNPRV